MIADLSQELTRSAVSYIIRRKDRIVCHATAPFPQGQLDMDIQMNDSSYQLCFNPRIGKSLLDRFSFRLYEGNQQIGSFSQITKRTGKFFGGYQYIQIQFRDNSYELYPVGLGEEGLYLCLHRENTLIAMASKELTTINHQDIYHLYLESEEIFLPFSAAVLYYDILSYGDLAEFNVYSKKTKIVYTGNTELKSKYDPTFIPRILQKGA